MKKLEDKNKGQRAEAKKDFIKKMFEGNKIFFDIENASKLVKEIQNESFEKASFDCSEREQITEDAEFEVIESKSEKVSFSNFDHNEPIEARIEKINKWGKRWEEKNLMAEKIDWEAILRAQDPLKMKSLLWEVGKLNRKNRLSLLFPPDPLDISFDFNNADAKTTYVVLSPEEQKKLMVGNWSKR